MKSASMAASALALFALAGLALAGCATNAPRDRGSAAQQAACRQRADEVYLKQNRGDVYRGDQYATSTRDAPYASSGLIGVTSSGLSGRYARDKMLDDCLAAVTAGGRPALPDGAAGTAPIP